MIRALTTFIVVGVVFMLSGCARTARTSPPPSPLPACSSPTSLAASGTPTTGAFLLSWIGSSTPGATYVLDESRNGGSWSQIASLSTTSYQVTGKTNGTYQYRVRSVRSGYADSEPVLFAPVTVTLICSAPSVLQILGTPGTGIYTIDWTRSSGPGASYILEESVNGGSWSQIASTASTTYSASGRPRGIYQYRIKSAGEGCTESAWTLSETVKVLPPCAAPARILASGTPDSGDYDMNWTVSPTAGVTYVLEENANNGGWRQIASTENTFISLRSKTNGAYQYRVRATKSTCADSAPRTSATVTVTLTCSAPSLMHVSGTPDSGVYALNWTTSPTSGVLYVLEENANKNGWVEIARTANTSHEVSVIASGTYQYRVRATKAGFADSRTTTSAPVKVRLTCSAPSYVHIGGQPNAGAYSVHWTTSTTPGVTYILEENRNGSGWVVIANTADTSSTLKDKRNGSYQYRVRASRSGYADSRSAMSKTVTVVRTCGAPEAIYASDMHQSGSYIMHWTATSTAGVAYILEEKDSSSRWKRVASTKNTSYALSGKPKGTYQYRVKATKSGYADSAWTVSDAVIVP